MRLVLLFSGGIRGRFLHGMMIWGCYVIAIITILSLCSCALSHKLCIYDNVICPVDYGILQANSGVERYRILYDCHKMAVGMGYNVSYRGIDELEIEIPQGATSIPLTRQTDFAGAKITVVNRVQSMYLYKLTQRLRNISVSAKEIDDGDFKTNSKLVNDKSLLIIKDGTPWVNTRKGYSYGATRTDIMIVNKGTSKTKPVQPYNNEASDPECQFCPISGTPVVFRNIIFERTKNSTKITHLVNIENQARVIISGVGIKTPEGHEMFGDAAITVTNVANLTMQDIDINGTYSQKNKYGYGVCLNNILNLRIDNMRGYAEWGIFGNNNINCARLSNCDINRFDIHCYGRDVSFFNCNFEGLYNQFSSIYGKVTFKKCTFRNFTPVLIESSYNAYTPFDIIWEDCVFNLDNKHNCLLNLMGLTADMNSRQEVKRKCIPNIIIKDCFINTSPELKIWNIIETGKVTYSETLDYIKSIKINGLRINDGELQMKIFSHDIRTTSPLIVKTKRISISK